MEMILFRLGIGPGRNEEERNTEEEVNDYLGRAIDARRVPLSAAAQLAGAAPDRSSSVGEVPMVVSIASRLALRAVVENWKGMAWGPQV